MKRDLVLCRTLLLAVEAWERPFAVPLDHLEADAEVVAYHAEKLMEAGYLIGAVLADETRLQVRVDRLTSAGHDLVELLRNAAAFRYAMDTLGDKVQVHTFALLEQVLNGYAGFRLSGLD